LYSKYGDMMNANKKIGENPGFGQVGDSHRERPVLEYIGTHHDGGDAATVYYRIAGTNKYLAQDMIEGDVVETRKKTLKVFFPF